MRSDTLRPRLHDATGCMQPVVKPVVQPVVPCRRGLKEQETSVICGCAAMKVIEKDGLNDGEFDRDRQVETPLSRSADDASAGLTD